MWVTGENINKIFVNCCNRFFHNVDMRLIRLIMRLVVGYRESGLNIGNISTSVTLWLLAMLQLKNSC